MVLDLFILLGVFVGLFIGFKILFSSFFRNSTNQYFAYSTFVLVFLTFFGWLEADHPLLLFLAQIMWEFLFPVTLFIYIIRTIDSKVIGKAKTKLLFIPFIISTVIHLVLDIDFKFGLYVLPFKESSLLVEGYDTLEYNLSFLFNIIMIVWSYALVFTSTDINDVKRKWLSRLCFFIMLILFIWFVMEYIESLIGLEIWSILWMFMSSFFVWVGYYGMYKLRLIEQKDEIHLLLADRSNNNTAVQKANQENHHIKKIENMMLVNELFKDPDLGRDRVANELGISQGYLSQLINSIADMSFVDYVNGYRVEAAKEMLSDAVFHKYSLQAIGLEAGFKSRSTFYATFQKFTQLIPGAFKKKHCPNI